MIAPGFLTAGSPPLLGEFLTVTALAVTLGFYARWRLAWRRAAPGAAPARGRITAALAGLILLAGARLARDPAAEAGRPRRLMLVIDSSGSMIAADLKPTRFAAALAEAGDLAVRAPEGEIGIVELNSTPRLALPPTPDREAARGALAALAGAPPGGGSDLDAAIALAAGFLVPDGGRVVVYTDGERDRSAAPNLARRLKEHGIRLELFGVGTPEGASLPGKPEPARLDEAVLRALAEENGGRYRRLGVRSGVERRPSAPRVPLSGTALALPALLLMAWAGWRGAPW